MSLRDKKCRAYSTEHQYLQTYATAKQYVRVYARADTFNRTERTRHHSSYTITTGMYCDELGEDAYCLESRLKFNLFTILLELSDPVFLNKKQYYRSRVMIGARRTVSQNETLGFLHPHNGVYLC